MVSPSGWYGRTAALGSGAGSKTYLQDKQDTACAWHFLDTCAYFATA